jgi:hypothetical protein
LTLFIVAPFAAPSFQAARILKQLATDSNLPQESFMSQ